jgi:hypothetical protein
MRQLSFEAKIYDEIENNSQRCKLLQITPFILYTSPSRYSAAPRMASTSSSIHSWARA